MMSNLGEIRQHCVITSGRRKIVNLQSCPIVLLEWKPESDIVRGSRPGKPLSGSDAALYATPSPPSSRRGKTPCDDQWKSIRGTDRSE